MAIHISSSFINRFWYIVFLLNFPLHLTFSFIDINFSRVSLMFLPIFVSSVGINPFSFLILTPLSFAILIFLYTLRTFVSLLNFSSFRWKKIRSLILSFLFSFPVLALKVLNLILSIFSCKISP